jgi:hypothetical protein
MSTLATCRQTIGGRCGEVNKQKLLELRDDQHPHAELYDAVPSGSTFKAVKHHMI